MKATTVVYAALLNGTAAATFDVNAVKNVATRNAKSSWEFGTVAEALLELDNMEDSVFGSHAFTTVPASTEGLAYAAQHIRPSGGNLIGDAQSNSDPASLGVMALMLGKTGSQYTTDAANQLSTLQTKTPKASNGAISHRSGSVAIWSDFMYMVPPFMAYYGVQTMNANLLAAAIAQCADYRSILKTSSGAWMHISAGSHSDTGTWATGNGWASMGMTRVLASMSNSTIATSDQKTEVAGWIKEIIDGAIASPRASSGLLHNYLNNANSLAETSGTSILAATVYRMAVLQPSVFGATYLAWADASYAAISSHVAASGIVAPAVDPYAYTSTTPYNSGSPEGQAFAVMLYAARRDCVAAGKCSGS